MSQNNTLTVYYDGLCRLCSTEINHYKKQAGAETFRFVDITDPSFVAATEGVDPVQVHKIMHVRNANGELKTKVDAFIAIWEQLPKYKFAAKAAKSSLVRPVLDLGYIAFATIRPYLPRKTESCEASPYCEVKKENT
jgi:predicted DCC family thiol-disulfide oxidoreductase YuxK